MQVRPAIKLNNSVRYFSRHSSSPPNNSKNHKHDHTADPCWSCGYVEPDPMFCNSCGKLQSFLATVKPYEKDNKHKDSTSPPTVSPPPVSYFDLLSQPKTVEVCAASLEAEYRSLQKVLHPDKYANACGRERDISLANSSIVNQAYQTLKRPEERVAHLLATYGVDVLAEDSLSFADPALMGDMFSLREQIEELEDSRGQEGWLQRLQGLEAELQEQVAELLPVLQEHFDQQQLDKATTLAVRLKYLFKAQEELAKML